MQIYDIASMTEQGIKVLRQRIRKERWTWTYNGLVCTHDDDNVDEFGRDGLDMIGLLYQGHRPPTTDIPVMG